MRARPSLFSLAVAYIFRFTQERLQGEALWRKRVDAKLTPESV
jgi:hypothetical protein